MPQKDCNLGLFFHDTLSAVGVENNNCSFSLLNGRNAFGAKQRKAAI